MEEVNLSEKLWQFFGEIGVIDRFENSLLEEYLMYDQTVKFGKCLIIILILGEQSLLDINIVNVFFGSEKIIICNIVYVFLLLSK